MWKGVEVMKFKIGDKVRVREDAVGIIKSTVGDICEVRDVNDDSRLPYLLSNRFCYAGENLEKITDPLAQKVLERNNKHTGGLTDDKVNSPAHYTKGEIEVIDIIKQLTQGYEPFEAYLVGNTIKYLARANFKENKQQDLEKAQWHIIKLLEEEE